MKTLLSLLLIISASYLTVAQTTAIPDINFEQRLIWNGFDSGTPDGIVLTANIDTIKYLTAGAANGPIIDLTGIEDFTSLIYLDCSSNNLSSLNVTQNINLTELHCNDNHITSLDVSQNIGLTYLNLMHNQVSVLNISQNTALTYLDCFNTNLSNLDVTLNTALISLICSNNNLTNLDLTQNILLEGLSFRNNQISNIDLNQNTNLISLRCENNLLTALDISNTSVLAGVDCSLNQITSLNFSHCPNLSVLKCTDNQLTCLNVKNGNNINFSFFWADNNPNLACIEVDDPIWSTTNMTSKPIGSSFSTNCLTPCAVGIKESDLSKLLFYPNPTPGKFTIDLGMNLTEIKTTLTNSLGQVIFTQQFESTDLFYIDIDAPSGIYFLKVESADGESQIIKVLKK